MIRVFATILLFCISAASQEPKATVIVSYQTIDAHQFGYHPWDHGIEVSAIYRFNSRWEGTVSGETSDGHKEYVGNGRHLLMSFGARYYVKDWLFITAGGLAGRDKNSEYAKEAYRGYLGAGIKGYGFVGTITAFAPPTSLTVDPNQVKGVNATVEKFQPFTKRFGVYGAATSSLASFNPTGNPAVRFSAIAWKLRGGFYFTF